MDFEQRTTLETKSELTSCFRLLEWIGGGGKSTRAAQIPQTLISVKADRKQYPLLKMTEMVKMLTAQGNSPPLV
jgi:hypothetical protein